MGWLKRFWRGNYFDPEDRGVMAHVKFGHFMVAVMAMAFIVFAIGAAIVQFAHQ
jgi:hypothetical protein